MIAFAALCWLAALVCCYAAWRRHSARERALRDYVLRKWKRRAERVHQFYETMRRLRRPA